MKIHYFQRYHKKENVATANTMLLLSRLYSYSSDKFFRFLKSEFFSDSFEPELVFTLQEKSVGSIPDATITQESFKVAVETKLTNKFCLKQLTRHLDSFGDKKYKVIITLAPELMDDGKKDEFEKELKEYNDDAKRKQENNDNTTPIYPIIHINTTFECLANAVQEAIDDIDYEMQEVLDDYLNYCYTDGLTPTSDSWKFLRVQLARTTFEFNIKENVYYDKADRGFRTHNYLGLYKDKSVRAIGKVCARITAIEEGNTIQFGAEFGELTEERKQKIKDSIISGDRYGYNLRTAKHRYFFVEQFYETDFKKITPKAPMGTRIFDLTKILGNANIPDVSELSEILKSKSWS